MAETLQAYADKVVAPQYRQRLKTAAQVAKIQGWSDPGKPECCGSEVAVTSMLGNPYFAECKECGKWAASMDGPLFSESGSSVQFLDPEKVELDTEATWIVGER